MGDRLKAAPAAGVNTGRQDKEMMRMLNLASLLKAESKGKQRRARGTRLAGPSAVLDALEPRTLLAATLSPDGVVLVTGTDAADAFVVRLNAAGTDVQVQGGGIALFRLSAVQSIQVQGGGGDDTLTIDTGAGLVGRAGATIPITFDGGSGADALVISGAPAGVSVNETILPGTVAGGGRVTSDDGQKSQAVGFSGVESLLDTSAAASLTVNLNDGSNLVEVVNGPAAAGAATTGIIRATDVTPVGVPVPAGTTPATATAAPATTPTASIPAAATQSKGRRKDDGTSKAEKKAEKARAKAARKAAKAAAKAAKAAARAASRSGSSGSAPLTPAAPETPKQSLLLGKAYVPLQFANKVRITINTAGGDDWIAVDNAAAAAGLTAITINAGDGQDHVAAVAKPVGVSFLTESAEDITADRGFVTVTEAPATPATPPPVENPLPVSVPTPDSNGDSEDGEDDDNEGRGSGDDGESGSEGDDKGDDEKDRKGKDTKSEDGHGEGGDDDGDDDDHGGDDHDD